MGGIVAIIAVFFAFGFFAVLPSIGVEKLAREKKYISIVMLSLLLLHMVTGYEIFFYLLSCVAVPYMLWKSHEVRGLLHKLNSHFMLIFPAILLMLSFLWPLPVLASRVPQAIAEWFPPHAALTPSSPMLWATVAGAGCLIANHIFAARDLYSSIRLGKPALAVIYVLSAAAAILCGDREWLQYETPQAFIHIALSLSCAVSFWQSTECFSMIYSKVPEQVREALDAGKWKKVTSDRPLWEKKQRRGAKLSKLAGCVVILTLLFRQKGYSTLWDAAMLLASIVLLNIAAYSSWVLIDVEDWAPAKKRRAENSSVPKHDNWVI